MRPGTLLRWYVLKRFLIQEISSNQIVIDIGGYDGYISYKLKRLLNRLNITIIDTDSSGLVIANNKGLQALLSSALALPIPANCIDAILCFDLIEHIKDDDKLIREISRVLKEGGKVLLTTPMENGVSFPFMKEGKVKIINEKWGHYRKGYSIKAIKDIFNKYDLTITKETKYFNCLSRFVYRLLMSSIPLRGKGLFYKLILRLEPYIKIGAQEHIVIARKEMTDVLQREEVLGRAP